MNNICVVLIEPQGALNVGSVCRSMMNFGISDLRLVNPCEDYSGFEARQMALKANIILDQALVFSNLSQAVEDCGLVFGTTRRFGKYRPRDIFLLPEQVAEQVSTVTAETQVAYVFGREDAGLYNSELEICSFYVTIPTDKSYKSINLSHAVNICMYELRKEKLKATFSPAKRSLPLGPLVTSKKMEYMFKHMRSTLLSIGYLNKDNPDHIIRAFRRVMNRAGLDDREVRIFQGLWSRIDWIQSKITRNIC